MRVKIPPSEALKQEISRLLEVGLAGVSNPLDTFVRLSSGYMLQMGMEREVEEFLGRLYYQRGSRRREGWHNGYETMRLKTSQGLLPVLVPQVRNTQSASGGFRSNLLSAIGASSQALQDMVMRMYV